MVFPQIIFDDTDNEWNGHKLEHIDRNWNLYENEK